MKIRMTFMLGEDDRAAIGQAMGCQRPATRTQAVQFISAHVALVLLETGEKLRRQRLLDDARQPLLFPAAAVAEAVAP